MSRSDSKSPTSSVRTGYTRRKKINRENQIPGKLNNNLSTNNYYYNTENHREKVEKSNYIKAPWATKYQNKNNLSNNHDQNNYWQKKHFKESNNYDYTTKTQITTLPGGIKRNKYEIKDDMYFRKPYNESRLFKMVHDYNSNINYEKDYDPITQGYNVNCFPTRQRYYGSYKRGVNDHDIFNIKFNMDYENGFNDCYYRKY